MKAQIKWLLMIIINRIHQFIAPMAPWLTSLIRLMILDVLTGLMKACLGLSEKSQKGYLDSGVMWLGGRKKLLTLVVICVAIIINELISPDSQIIVTVTFSYYIATEALSILENSAACGLPLPDKLIKVLEKMKQDTPS